MLWTEQLAVNESPNPTTREGAEILKGQFTFWLGSMWSLAGSCMKECEGEEVFGKGAEIWDGEDGAGVSGETGEGVAEPTRILSRTVIGHLLRAHIPLDFPWFGIFATDGSCQKVPLLPGDAAGVVAPRLVRKH